MHIVVPHAKNAPMLTAVRLALENDGHPPDLWEMREEESYFILFANLWRRQETFINVEHDIVVWPGAIQSLIDCPEPWCGYGYHSNVGWLVDGLGCVKFGKELMCQYPQFFDDPRANRSWKWLDRYITNKLKDEGVMLHAHMPGVTNLNPALRPKEKEEKKVLPDWIKAMQPEYLSAQED